MSPPVPLTYRIVMILATPFVRWWGRLQVVGAEHLPASGPTVLMVNHDSAWDPLVMGVAAGNRQIQALAKSSLWKYRPVAWVLDHMGQIPIERGRGDLAAMTSAIDELRRGGCIGVFPEGTMSRGLPKRPLSGAGRLVLAVPETQLVCAALRGSVDMVRFPHRPRLRVEFFPPQAGPPHADESAIALTRRVMGEVRENAPYAIPGRRKKAAEYRKAAAENGPA